MMEGPIVIVEDDGDDQLIYAETIRDLGLTNPIRSFYNAKDALIYLRDTVEIPFVIFCDINMPAMNGLEFKETIQSDDYLREKSIPFIFISTNSSKATVKRAYLLTVQGYFEKPSSMKNIREVLSLALEYWKHCKHINNS